jgi:SAM-dependent methyltransferase
MTATTSIDEERLHALLGQAVVEFGAAVNAALVVIGDRLGLYRELSEHGPLTSAELAERTTTSERYVREWASAQAASGWIGYEDGRYSMSPEQTLMFALPGSPAFVGGAFQTAVGAVDSREHIEDAFRSGAGYGWHEHTDDVFDGCRRFFEPGYRANIVQSWIPALDGVEEKLKSGAQVADVGCGHGASVVVMAEAYPNSEISGFDFHGPSIETAKQRARDAGVAERTNFATAGAKDYPGSYDLICFFDCLHDMGDPVGIAAYARDHLNPGGTVLLVEPFALDGRPENIAGNPMAALLYTASTVVCTPNSLSQEVGLGLGAQAGEARLRAVFEEAGFSHFRKAAETPLNLILEAKA